MNKAITDGLVFMPPPFANGLTVWSSGDGTPGSDTYAVSGTGVFVPADQNFDGCLEILKSQTTTKLRYMGQTTILPGCYLRVTARVKAVAGAFPAVRIAGWPGKAGGVKATGLTDFGPATQLTAYGQVVEVTAIIGTGARTGVDMVWNGAIYGHLGLDLTGPNGGVVRVDDIVIEDVTSVFLRDMLGVVDVRDFGAKGDGVTDDSAAFEAADAAANGREVLVSKGVYRLANDVTIDNQIRFEGTVTLPTDKKLILRKNFDFATYVDALGDETLAFKKAFQALLNFADHESLDLNGRRIQITEPIDMQAAVPDRTSFATRRVIRNGQIEAQAGGAWAPVVVTSQATYAASNNLTLTGVVNVANVPVGALITGNGVGREIYVKARNIAQQTLTLSNPLFDAEGTQAFTFTRFKYMIDFSGFESLSQFSFDDIEFQCSGVANGILLAKAGSIFHLRDCFINGPKDRGLTSIGTACQGLMFDRCQWLSAEQSLPVESRISIGFNANANDVKIRDCRIIRFKHFGILGGSGNLIVGNHWFHGDDVANGVRKGGLIFTTPNVMSVITGNYIDNNFIEWTNEHSSSPALGAQFSFGALTITGNIFTSLGSAPWFNWIVIKPHGPGHYIQGLSVTGNVFRALNGTITRAEAVDTTFADLDYSRMRNVSFEHNTFNGVTEEVYNPAVMSFTQTTASQTWVLDTLPRLPFKGWARTVETVAPDGKVTDASNVAIYDMPYAETEYGPTKTQIRVVWKSPTKGKIRARVRMDNPI